MSQAPRAGTAAPGWQSAPNELIIRQLLDIARNQLSAEDGLWLAGMLGRVSQGGSLSSADEARISRLRASLARRYHARQWGGADVG